MKSRNNDSDKISVSGRVSENFLRKINNKTSSKYTSDLWVNFCEKGQYQQRVTGNFWNSEALFKNSKVAILTPYQTSMTEIFAKMTAFSP